MAENAPGFTQACTNIPPYSLVGGPENIKLLFDECLDNRREILGRSRAWEAITLLQQQNVVAFSHAVNMGSLLSAQAGVIETQSQVSPIRTGAADSQNQQPAGAVYPPIRNVDQSSATANGVVQTALAQVAASIANMQDVVTKLADALAPVLVNAAGGASTPSQTQPKPTGAA